MLQHAVLALKPLGAFDAVELAKPREIFCWLGVLMLGKVFRRTEIGMDLVEISVLLLVNSSTCKGDWKVIYLFRRFVLILLIAPILPKVEETSMTVVDRSLIYLSTEETQHMCDREPLGWQRGRVI